LSFVSISIWKRLKELFKKHNTKDVLLDNLPTAGNYEKSYMHRDTITHLIMTWFVFRNKFILRNIGGIDFIFICFFLSTDIVITASADGHVKFWKKRDDGIEFVKHFRTHLGKKCLFI
jgi:peptidylprolyl isomerase domain and WD repeat-containing protein 1